MVNNALCWFGFGDDITYDDYDGVGCDGSGGNYNYDDGDGGIDDEAYFSKDNCR